MGGAVGAPAEAGSRLPPAPRRGLPDSPGNLLRFIQEVHAHYLHQRPLHTPVVVHCRYGPHGGGGGPPTGAQPWALLTPASHRSSGVGRTGAFALLYAAVQEVEAGNGIPELPQLVRRMRQQRKHMLQEKVRRGWWGRVGGCGRGPPPRGSKARPG